MNPIFPDAQPYDTYLLIGVAILMVWWHRRGMFSQADSVVTVIPGARDHMPASFK